MRNLILFILILLGSVSCGTRHKIKIADVQKREIDNEKTYQGETQNLENSSEKVENSSAENTIIQRNWQKETQHILQNFVLKNNGKCLENSAIRFVSITDNKGNKTEIPVNDNTELNFSHQNDIQTENQALKTENQRLKNEVSEKETHIKTLRKELYSEKQKRQEIHKKLDLQVKSQKPSIWLFIALMIVSVVVWEFVKTNLKKLYNYVSIWRKKP